VDDGELVGVVGREEGREDAVLGAPPPQQLARRARRPAAHVDIDIPASYTYLLPAMAAATTTTGLGKKARLE